jgi:hypothetical protein
MCRLLESKASAAAAGHEIRNGTQPRSIRVYAVEDSQLVIHPRLRCPLVENMQGGNEAVVGEILCAASKPQQFALLVQDCRIRFPPFGAIAAAAN